MSSMSIHVSLKLILSAVSEAKFSPIFEAAFLWYAEYAESKDSKYFLIYHPLNCANVFKYKSRLRCMRNSSIIRIRAHIIPIRILKHPYFICNAASNSTCKKKKMVLQGKQQTEIPSLWERKCAMIREKKSGKKSPYSLPQRKTKSNVKKVQRTFQLFRHKVLTFNAWKLILKNTQNKSQNLSIPSVTCISRCYRVPEKEVNGERVKTR